MNPNKVREKKITYAELRNRFLKIADGIGVGNKAQFTGPLSKTHEALISLLEVCERDFC